MATATKELRTAETAAPVTEPTAARSGTEAFKDCVLELSLPKSTKRLTLKID